MNVLEKILKEVRRVRHLKVDMTLKLSKQRKTMGNNHLVTSSTVAVVNSATFIHNCFLSKREWVGKLTVLSTVRPVHLAVL